MLPPIRMIATDLDSTLLPRSKSITPYALSVLEQLQERGLKIAIATGRPWRSVQKFLEQFPFDAVICHNGAIININGVVVEKNVISKEVLQQEVALLLDAFSSINLIIECEDIMYTNFDPSSMGWNRDGDHYSDFRHLEMDYAEKMMIVFDEHVTIEACQALLLPELYMDVSIDKRVGMIMSQQARKHYAVAHLARHYGIDMQAVAAFGDDVNDLGMVRDCGYGVAMVNGLEEVQQVAHAIAPNNEEDGVARWLSKHFQLDVQVEVTETKA